ncbi:DUF4190 domain-containing protein [Promicromonospora soli]
MTQPDEWKSPYDPPDQAGPPSPYQQPYEQPYQQPYLQQPAPEPEYQQGSAYQAGPYQSGPYQPQPPQYGTPYGYAAPPEKNALGVWSLVLGILSVVMLFSCFVGFLAAIPAVITGHLSRKAHKEGLADNPGLALGGIITGWVTIGLTLLAAVGIAVLFSIPEFREGFFSETSYDY